MGKVTIVLSGGGLRGMAHVGALKAIRALDIPVHEYIGTSMGSLVCALAGVFPPLKMNGIHYIDGGILTNLPVRMARQRGADLIIAVNLGLPALRKIDEVPEQESIIDILLQSNGITMRRILQLQLREFIEYPLILVEPYLPTRRMFDFEETDRSIRAGERAALNVLRDHPLLGLI